MGFAEVNCAVLVSHECSADKFEVILCCSCCGMGALMLCLHLSLTVPY
uniref:Uncharacterized protein n=1 Tax=Rhizophora mucronata TaxID=61149 RepID=A0A2P2IXL1_RHIMU